MKHTCGGCSTEWTGMNIAHCGACHRTFSTVKNFDSHRFQGRCADPAGLKRKTGPNAWEPLLRRDKRGFWVGAQERPEGLVA